MSTRKLIIAALICGIAILIAGAVQLIEVAQQRHSSSSGSSQAPAVTTTLR